MSDVEPIQFRPGNQGQSRQNAPDQQAKTAASLRDRQDMTDSHGPHRGAAQAQRQSQQQNQQPPQVCFDRLELTQILSVYGRKVASGDWRDYAMDFGKERAVFSIFRRASECPIYRIEKSPKLARKQGAYAVVSAHGLILKRGHDLRRVLHVLDKSLRLV